MFSSMKFYNKKEPCDNEANSTSQFSTQFEKDAEHILLIEETELKDHPKHNHLQFQQCHTPLSSEYDNESRSCSSSSSSSSNESSLFQKNKSKQSQIKDTVYILGKKYSSQHDYTLLRNDETSLYWFTYRRDFPELAPYGLTTDAGWGCMLRATQMMIAQALKYHYVGRQYNSKQNKSAFSYHILQYFADHPGADCPFSLHNMIATGLRYEMLPGEWYGPTTACLVMRDLCFLHEKQRKFSSIQQNKLVDDLFRVIVVQEGCIYCNIIEQTVIEKQHSHKSSSFIEKLRHPLEKTQDQQQQAWDYSLLLLIPLRLGLKTFNAKYSKDLIHALSLKQSIGFTGGSPRHALWFYGGSADCTKLFGLDPHTVQPAPLRDKKRYNAVQLSSDYMRSVYCSNPSTMNIEKIDPSLALGFYCRDKEDFLNLKENLKGNELVTVMDAAPDYTSNVGVLAEMIDRVDELDPDDDAEDDYVFL